MKLNEITGKPKARDESDLLAFIKDGVFTKDGSHLAVESFDCSTYMLTSLEGCPRKVLNFFLCFNNNLTSLEGCPQEVKYSFDCHGNKLENLKGGPRSVGGGFSCHNNKITSLKDGPQHVVGAYICYNNFLKSLEGCPQKVGDHFICHSNKLASLVGCPQEVNGNFSCSNNKLTSLKDVHKHVKKINGAFFARRNLITSHVLGLLKIEGCTEVNLDITKVEKIINKYLPLGDIFDCQEELIEAGFPEYAQL